MSTTKYDIEQKWLRVVEDEDGGHLDSTGRWKGLLPDKDLPESMTEKEMQEFQRNAYSSIILSLSYQVLRKVSHKKTIVGVWKKLEERYRTRAFPNRIYMKEHLYGLKIEESKPIDDSLDEFNKLVLDL